LSRAKLSVVRPDQAPLEPGRRATPEEVRKADAEIRELLAAILPMNLPAAAEYLRRHRPSPEAIALLGTRMIQLHEKLRQRNAARGPRDRDALARALREILRAKPRAGVDDVLEALRGRPAFDVDDEGNVSWIEGEATRNNIARRIARLRPKDR